MLAAPLPATLRHPWGGRRDEKSGLIHRNVHPSCSQLTTDLGEHDVTELVSGKRGRASTSRACWHCGAKGWKTLGLRGVTTHGGARVTVWRDFHPGTLSGSLLCAFLEPSAHLSHTG